MPAYQYEAVYANGEHAAGVVEALNENDAVAQIRQTCEVVLSLREVRTGTKDPLERFRKVDSKSLALTCRQFSIILKAGLPLVQTVDLVAGQTGDKALSRLLRQVAEDVGGGWSLSYSLEQRGKQLPVTFRESIRAGEEAGDLVSAFERMSIYYERMHKTKTKAASTLLYPAFVIAVAVIVVAVIMIYAVPALSSTFVSMDVELPWVTKALIGLSNFIAKYIWLIVAVIAAAAFGLRLYGHTEKGGSRLDKMKLSIPIIGKINQMAGASQFAHTMSTLLTAGMSILQCVEVSGRTMSNECMAGEVLGTLAGVESGHSLGECMSLAEELPAMLVQMVTVGEATGSMESTLEVLAEYYDSETDVKTKRAITLLEPTIIVILSIFVAFILVAVYLPMFSLYANM